MLIDLAQGEAGIIVPEADLRQLFLSLQFHEEKLYEILRVVILAYGLAVRRDGGQGFKVIENWFRDNYVELREHLPPDVKRLYLSHFAFQGK